MFKNLISQRNFFNITHSRFFASPSFPLPQQENPDYGKQFENFSTNAIALGEVPMFMESLEEIFAKYPINYASNRNIYLNFCSLEQSNTLDFMRTEGVESPYKTNSIYKEHSEFNKFLNIESGYYHYKWQAFERLMAMQRLLYIQLVNEYKNEKKDKLFKLLSQKIAGRPQTLDPLKKAELETEIRAIRKVLHPAFSIVVVPNRGLIVAEILQIAAEDGFETILICEETDKDAPAVLLADQAYFGDPDNLNGIMDILLKLKLFDDYRLGIYAGWRFLAENPELPRVCKFNNMVFIGPSAESMHELGDKANAREVAKKMGFHVMEGWGDDRKKALQKLRQIFPKIVVDEILTNIKFLEFAADWVINLSTEPNTETCNDIEAAYTWLMESELKSMHQFSLTTCDNLYEIYVKLKAEQEYQSSVNLGMRY